MKLSDLYILGAVALGIGAVLFGTRPVAPSPGAAPVPRVRVVMEAVPIKEAGGAQRPTSLFESGSLGIPDETSP